MPHGLKRYQEGNDDHFITFSCHRRNAYLTDSESRSVVEHIFERTRERHELRIYGYVLMPEHVHPLVSEPPHTPLATVLKAMKQETAKKLKGDREHFWQPRYYDFNVFTHEKFSEKLRYIHRNPVTRGLVDKPEDWPWSSYRHYQSGQPGIIQIESWWTEQTRKPRSDT